MLKNSFIILFFSICCLNAQTDTTSQIPPNESVDLDAILNNTSNSQKSNPNYTYATFKGTKIINGHSIESPGAGILQFIIYHRFSSINQGLYDVFGLDGARVRLGLDYGVTRRLSVGFGRTSDQKTLDSYGKYKILMQTEDNKIPISLVAIQGISLRTDKSLSKPYLVFAHRLSYLTQVLIAKKFNSSFSLQLTPTLVHTNLTETNSDKNTIFAMGWGSRMKISKRTSINLEHFAKLPNQTNSNVTNVIALGVDIETGGHVFQFHITNTQSMIEQLFIPFNTNRITDGQLNLGFNISRVFTVNKKAVNKYN